MFLFYVVQAKELARVQMQVERQQRKHTGISDLVRQENFLINSFPFN